MKNLTENDPRTFAIIGAAMEVHRLLGCGFLEPVYQAALMNEIGLLLNFGTRSLEYRRFIVSLPVSSA
jgi:hypothetical protein